MLPIEEMFDNISSALSVPKKKRSMFQSLFEANFRLQQLELEKIKCASSKVSLSVLSCGRGTERGFHIRL